MSRAIKETHTIILIALLAAVFIWVADAALDAVVLHEGSFGEILFSVGRHELIHRALLVAMLFLFGFVVVKKGARRSRTEETLKKHSAAIETSMDGVAIYNRDGAYIYVNQAYASINGYELPDELIGKPYQLGYDHEELARMEQDCIPVLKKTGRWQGELLAKRRDGSAYYQEASATMLDDGGRVCIIRDISGRKRSEDRLQRSERFLNTIFDSIHDPFCIFDRDFRIVRVNNAYARMKNRPADDLIGKKCHEVLHNRTTVCEGCVVHKTFHSADPCAKDKLVTLHDGTEIWVDIYTYPILDEKGTVSHTIEYTRDVTERKKYEDEKLRLIEKLEYLSSTDDLTGLKNRRALTNSLLYEIDRATRYDSSLSLILCDIDNFKEINDTYGHDTGDRALQIISYTLKNILRKTDIAGRHGGDEFMLVLPDTSIKGAENLADKLLTAVRDAELRLPGGAAIQLSMSIGISAFQIGSDNIDSFIKRTDDAMYASKQGGRNQVSTVNAYPLFP